MVRPYSIYWRSYEKKTEISLEERNSAFRLPCFFKNIYIYLFILTGGYLLYSIVVVFAIHWHESAMGVHVSPVPNPPSHLLPHPIQTALGFKTIASTPIGISSMLVCLECFILTRVKIHMIDLFYATGSWVLSWVGIKGVTWLDLFLRIILNVRLSKQTIEKQVWRRQMNPGERSLCFWWRISSVQSLSRVWHFATPWTAAHQASLFIINSQAYSDSCPLSWWCHPTILSSAVPFSSHLQSFPASGAFPMSQFFASHGQSTGASASASVL